MQALTLSLCSLRLTMTAVICWSIKMRMVQSRAGSAATSSVHHGLVPSGSISQPRFFEVGCREKAEKVLNARHEIIHGIKKNDLFKKKI